MCIALSVGALLATATAALSSTLVLGEADLHHQTGGVKGRHDLLPEKANFVTYLAPLAPADHAQSYECSPKVPCAAFPRVQETLRVQ